MSIVLSFIIWVLIGLATAYVAKQRGRDPFVWFAVGMFLGLLGLLLLIFLPAPSTAKDQKEKRQEQSIAESEVQTLDLIGPFHWQDYLIKDWFCLDKTRQQQGPMEFTALKILWREGKLDISSFVWSDGMENWRKIKDLPALSEFLNG